MNSPSFPLMSTLTIPAQAPEARPAPGEQSHNVSTRSKQVPGYLMVNYNLWGFRVKPVRVPIVRESVQTFTSER